MESQIESATLFSRINGESQPLNDLKPFVVGIGLDSATNNLSQVHPRVRVFIIQIKNLLKTNSKSKLKYNDTAHFSGVATAWQNATVLEHEKEKKPKKVKKYILV